MTVQEWMEKADFVLTTSGCDPTGKTIMILTPEEFQTLYNPNEFREFCEKALHLPPVEEDSVWQRICRTHGIPIENAKKA